MKKTQIWHKTQSTQLPQPLNESKKILQIIYSLLNLQQKFNHTQENKMDVYLSKQL